jgi:hypothetical protein
MIEKHFVTFVSPGTLVPETTTKEIDSWDVDKATEMAREVRERYNATPYSFHFTTRSNEGELDSKETARSCNYFLGGQVLTLQDVKDRNDSKDSILISNMENNGYDRVVQNDNSWRATLPLGENDVVLEFNPAT